MAVSGQAIGSDLLSKLLPLMPEIVAWVNDRSTEIRQSGHSLDERQRQIASAVGVRHPELVRVKALPRIKPPEHPKLAQIASDTGLISPRTGGITFGHSIYIRSDLLGDDRLLSHELRHVYQYEMAGSIEAFLVEYLRQIAVHGYNDAPLEVDARGAEIGS
jgi:hypothetical protein